MPRRGLARPTLSTRGRRVHSSPSSHGRYLRHEGGQRHPERFCARLRELPVTLRPRRGVSNAGEDLGGLPRTRPARQRLGEAEPGRPREREQELGGQAAVRRRRPSRAGTVYVSLYKYITTW